MEDARCESGWTGDRCMLPLFHEGEHSNEENPMNQKQQDASRGLSEVWCRKCDQPATVEMLVNRGGVVETMALCDQDAWALRGTARREGGARMNAQRTVELDWAADETVAGPDVDAHGAATAERLGLTVVVVEEYGPGGGWPLLRFTGPDDAIDLLVREYSHDLADCEGDVHWYDAAGER